MDHDPASQVEIRSPGSDAASPEVRIGSTTADRLSMGIDEAGFGPLLGPLVVAGVVVACDRPAEVEQVLAEYGVRDSKRLHKSGQLAPLEQVALPGLSWILGRRPVHAAEVFTAFQESEEDRCACPWMAGASQLLLPVAASRLPEWRVPGARPRSLQARLIQPATINAARTAGTNRSELLLERVMTILAAGAGSPGPSMEVVCDRQGGRVHYREQLTSALPAWTVSSVEESSTCCTYRFLQDARRLEIRFAVGGETVSRFCALASCLAKYVRELHMILFNRWWCQAVDGLRPTAGYPEDALRWLADVGPDHWQAWRHLLIRGDPEALRPP